MSSCWPGKEQCYCGGEERSRIHHVEKECIVQRNERCKKDYKLATVCSTNLFRMLLSWQELMIERRVEKDACVNDKQVDVILGRLL